MIESWIHISAETYIVHFVWPEPLPLPSPHSLRITFKGPKGRALEGHYILALTFNKVFSINKIENGANWTFIQWHFLPFETLCITKTIRGCIFHQCRKFGKNCQQINTLYSRQMWIRIEIVQSNWIESHLQCKTKKSILIFCNVLTTLKLDWPGFDTIVRHREITFEFSRNFLPGW